MAVHVLEDNRLLARAFGVSLGVHFLLALFLPVWAARQSPDLQPVETLSFAHLIRLQIERPATHAPPAALPQTTKRSHVVTFARVKTELSVSTRKPATPRPIAVTGPTGVHAAAPKYVKATKAAPLYARSPSTAEPVAVVRNSSPATPQPASVVGEHAITGANADRGGVLPLGAAQDPILDPKDLALLQKVGVHVTITVTVGEDGRTQHVVFDPDLDAATERQLQQILANADWDAAVCGGGVSCEGTATIKL